MAFCVGYPRVCSRVDGETLLNALGLQPEGMYERFGKEKPAAVSSCRGKLDAEASRGRKPVRITPLTEGDRPKRQDLSADGQRFRVSGRPTSPPGLLHIAAPDVYGWQKAPRPMSPGSFATRQESPAVRLGRGRERTAGERAGFVTSRAYENG